MTGTLLVTPEKLNETAQAFSGGANSVKSITDQMISTATALGNTWLGDAATTYINKFKSLQEDMNQMYRMITEHCNDLQEMARNYQTADQAVVEAANALNNNAIN